jgi:hypothetical protein
MLYKLCIQKISFAPLLSTLLWTEVTKLSTKNTGYPQFCTTSVHAIVDRSRKMPFIAKKRKVHDNVD